MRRLFPILAHAALLFLPRPAEAQPRFVDAADALGITHFWGDRWVGGDLGGGVALEDFDRDGDLDVFLATQAGFPVAVFRNDAGTFTDISATTVDMTGPSKQLLFVDLDNDGWRDLFVGGWESPSRLYANVEGAFEDRSSALTRDPSYLPMGATAADYDGDGDADLHVAYWRVGAPGVESRNTLYRNDGGFQFTDVTAEAGVGSRKKSYQSVFSDLSGDGWPDLVVAQDKGGGLTYYENQRDGTFLDRTTESGLEGRESLTGTLIDGMGIAVGDYDGDQRLDVYATNIATGNVLYRNLGDGTFEERAIPSGTVTELVGWGTEFLDADLDGLLDLYVGNFSFTTGAIGKQDRLYRNRGDGTFANASVASGVAARDLFTFGLAAGDLDGNGRLDVVVLQGDAPTRVLLNQSDPARHWLHLELEGVTSNRDGLGARVVVTAGGTAQLREQRAGTSYLSHSSHTLEWGLGMETTADVEITWPSGQVDRYTAVAADKRYRAREGSPQLVEDNPAPVLPPEVGPGRPTPFSEWTAVEIQSGADQVTGRIVDVRGRRVRTLRARVQRGSATLVWEGDRDDGGRAASGIYRMVVDTPGGPVTRTLVLVR